MEFFKRWLLSFNASKDLFCHPLEGFIFFFFTILVDFDMLLLSWISSSVKEGFKVLLKRLLPEERFVTVSG